MAQYSANIQFIDTQSKTCGINIYYKDSIVVSNNIFYDLDVSLNGTANTQWIRTHTMNYINLHKRNREAKTKPIVIGIGRENI